MNTKVASGSNAIKIQKVVPNRLTTRQLEIMKLLADGSRNVDIAEVLKISVRTVNNHLDRIYRTLGVNNRIAALRAVESNAPAKRRKH